jgi:hypothetical protein
MPHKKSARKELNPEQYSYKFGKIPGGCQPVPKDIMISSVAHTES